MKLLLKILFFLLAIFQTNISEAKVFVLDGLVLEKVFCNIFNSEKSGTELQDMFLEKDFSGTCKSENDLVNYRDWAKSIEAVAARSSTKLPTQIHHFATNKHSLYTKQMGDIAKQ